MDLTIVSITGDIKKIKLNDEDIFDFVKLQDTILINVFVHPSANTRKRIFINNYKATKNAIRKGLEGLPTVDDGIQNAENVRHPFRNDP